MNTLRCEHQPHVTPYVLDETRVEAPRCPTIHVDCSLACVLSNVTLTSMTTPHVHLPARSPSPPPDRIRHIPITFCRAASSLLVFRIEAFCFSEDCECVLPCLLTHAQAAVFLEDVFVAYCFALEWKSVCNNRFRRSKGGTKHTSQSRRYAWRQVSLLLVAFQGRFYCLPPLPTSPSIPLIGSASSGAGTPQLDL
jgi:hypothetical protein